MNQDFFKDLPSEITINILSRLPAQSTMSCKFVCKPWLDLLASPDFVKSHLSRSVPGLAVFKGGKQSKPFKIIEFVDRVGLKYHEQRWNTVFKMDVPFHEPLLSSTNGLLLLCKAGFCRDGDIILCNPITREYIKLPSPRRHYSQPMFQLDTFGFGVSKITGQCKVVRMFLDEKLPLTPQFKCDKFKCQVYTVGTGLWRRIASGKRLMYGESGGTFLNGNLHFLTHKDSSCSVSYLDLETEFFHTFSGSAFYDPHKVSHMSVLRGCLCICNNSANESTSFYEIDIWLMKEYGNEKSWTKEYTIRKVYKDVFLGQLCPIKVFEDGDILMELGKIKLLYYSSKIKTIREVDLCGLGSNVLRSTAVYAPSFVRLKAFATENVSSF